MIEEWTLECVINRDILYSVATDGEAFHRVSMAGRAANIHDDSRFGVG